VCSSVGGVRADLSALAQAPSMGMGDGYNVMLIIITVVVRSLAHALPKALYPVLTACP
jgi:hypothetical protein